MNEHFSLENPSKDRRLFVDAIVCVYARDLSKRLSNLEKIVEVQFEFGLRMIDDARFCKTDL